MLTSTQGWSIRGISFQSLQDLITKNKGRIRINSLPISLLALERKPIPSTRNDLRKKIGLFHWLIILLILFVFVTPTRGDWGIPDSVGDREGGESGNYLIGEEADKESREHSKSKSNFVLTIKDNLVSLDAKDASLVEIVEEIGSRMKIEVISDISEEKKVTVKFVELPLKAAIERLREFADIAYITVPKNPPSKITTSDPKDSEGEEGKITKILVFPKGKGVEVSEPDVSTKKEEAVEEDVPQMEAEEEKVGEEEASQPEPFKFEFDPSEFEEE